ncbi:MAG TPA: response regulator, partial [Kofleriaceae bacterium]|nr:response regulator [Kofleriaceae bacterium]
MVEDDAELGEVLTDFYQEQGHRVSLATNAPHALRLLAAMEPDVLLIDISLPVFDGNFLATEVRRRGGTARIIAITGRKGAVQPALFDDVILKPLSPHELLKVLVTPVGGGIAPVGAG